MTADRARAAAERTYVVTYTVFGEENVVVNAPTGNEAIQKAKRDNYKAEKKNKYIYRTGNYQARWKR